MRKLPHILAALCCFAFLCPHVFAAEDAELWKLRNIATTLYAYMQVNGGQLPPNLEPLGDYIDVAKFFGAAPGSSIKFTEQYALLTSKPKLRLPQKGDVQLLLLEVRPENERRAAIWLAGDSIPETGFLREAELAAATGDKLDLQNLKPMGGVVPVTSQKVIEATTPRMTEYEARVLALAREGKIKPDPPYRPETNEAIPPPQNTPSPIATPTPSTPRQVPSTPSHEAAHVESPSPSFPIIPVAILVVVIVAVIVFMMRRKIP